jgi:hypothetical protein
MTFKTDRLFWRSARPDVVDALRRLTPSATGGMTFSPRNAGWVLLECYYDFDKIDALFMKNTPEHRSFC